MVVRRKKKSNLLHLPSSIKMHLTSSFFHHNDCEELVKVLVHRCKKIGEVNENKNI